MEPEPAKAARPMASRRAFWRAGFCVGAVPLIGCIAVIAARPMVGAAPSWIYWVAVGSVVLCAIAAAQLWSYERYDAADEAAWLARVGTRSSKSAWNDLDGVDD